MDVRRRKLSAELKKADINGREQPVRDDHGPGNYPWDKWERCALQLGVPEELAMLGRAVYREAYQHSWSEDLQAECGWMDSGRAMIVLALLKPQETRRRWQHLLDTDGERIRPQGPSPLD